MWLFLLLMETVPVEAGIEIWFVLLDVEVGLDTAGELLQPMGLDTVVETWAECSLLDVEVGLDTAGKLLQPMGLDTVVEPWAECSLLDVEMRRCLGSLPLFSEEDYVLIFTFGLEYHLGSPSLGLFHD